MNESFQPTFLTTFSKSGMPLILTDNDINSVLSINLAALKYLRDLRITIISSNELVNILRTFTKENRPSQQVALECQSLVKNSVNQFVNLTVRVQQEALSGKPVLLFSIVGSTQITGPYTGKTLPPPETMLPVFLVGFTPEGTIQYVNRPITGVDMDQILGSKLEHWTFSDRWGDIHYYERAVATAQPVIYNTRIMGPNGIPIKAKIYLSPIFERDALIGFVIATLDTPEN